VVVSPSAVARTLVRGMNLDLLSGVIEGIDDDPRLMAR
jgi:hypothetical protein